MNTSTSNTASDNKMIKSKRNNLMSYYTNKEILEFLTAEATRQGLRFEEQGEIVNGHKAYMFIDRVSKRIISKNHTLRSTFTAQKASNFICELKYIV